LIQSRDGPERQRVLSRDAEAELAGAAKTAHATDLGRQSSLDLDILLEGV
jgi:hypothetical protein